MGFGRMPWGMPMPAQPLLQLLRLVALWVQVLAAVLQLPLLAALAQHQALLGRKARRLTFSHRPQRQQQALLHRHLGWEWSALARLARPRLALQVQQLLLLLLQQIRRRPPLLRWLPQLFRARRRVRCQVCRWA